MVGKEIDHHRTGAADERLASTIYVGALIEFPLHRLRVVSVEFERDAAFPDAVAQVVVERGLEDFRRAGAHISTPWGMVQVVVRGQAAEQPKLK